MKYFSEKGGGGEKKQWLVNGEVIIDLYIFPWIWCVKKLHEMDL